MRLALELFRGEPAISRFVRHFTTYPQVIATFCNMCACGPPCRVTGTSTCPWVAHRVSGLFPATHALFGLAFAAPACVTQFGLPQKITRWVILQEARPQTARRQNTERRPQDVTRSSVRCVLSSRIVLGLLVGTRFQVLFHSPCRGAFHLSLTVLVHYRSPHVFSLTEWTPSLRTGLACPVLLRCSTEVDAVPLRDSHPLRSGGPDLFESNVNW